MPRSTLRYSAVEPAREGELIERIKRPAREHSRYGHRRVAALPRRDGWAVNPKRVQRPWRAEGLEVPKARWRRRRLGGSKKGRPRREAERPNHVRSHDSVMDQASDGERLKILPVVDDSTRRCLGIQVARSLKAEDVGSPSDGLFRRYGEPERIRGDKGPGFVAAAVRDRPAGRGVKTLCIAPGSTWEKPAASRSTADGRTGSSTVRSSPR